MASAPVHHSLTHGNVYFVWDHSVSYSHFFYSYFLLFFGEGRISSPNAKHYACFIGGRFIENFLQSGLDYPGSAQHHHHLLPWASCITKERSGMIFSEPSYLGDPRLACLWEVFAWVWKAEECKRPHCLKAFAGRGRRQMDTRLLALWGIYSHVNDPLWYCRPLR